MLRTHKLGEADRILTLLTRYHGMIRVSARGVRRPKSKLGARVEPFALIDAQFYRGKSLDGIAQAVTITPWGHLIAADYELYTRACTMAEVTQYLSDDGSMTQLFLLMRGALDALAGRHHLPELTMNAYLVRAMAIAGWAPSFHDCAVCGKPGPWSAFQVASGGAVCDECRPPGAMQPHRITLALLSDLLSGRWDRADTAPDYAIREASAIVAAWVQFHLEKRVQSYEVLRSGRRMEGVS